MIAGQSPRLTWEVNPARQKRTIEQAMEIARAHGVTIGDDVAFFEDEDGDLAPEKNGGNEITARGPRVSKYSGEIVSWNDLLNSISQKVPFIIRPDILESDEAIVGVFGHEMYELEALRTILSKGKTPIEHFIGHTRPDNAGNLHDQAWDYSDKLVAQMREKKLKGGN